MMSVAPQESEVLVRARRVGASGFVGNLVQSHGATLAHLSLRNCVLSKKSTTLICRKCVELETLKLSVPSKDMVRVRQSRSIAKEF